MNKEIYIENAEIFKVLSDSNRLQIIDMLSSGEMCVCKILENLDITQPTLSHHLRVLGDCEIVISRKEGNWIYYKLNVKKIKNVLMFLNEIYMK